MTLTSSAAKGHLLPLHTAKTPLKGGCLRRTPRSFYFFVQAPRRLPGSPVSARAYMAVEGALEGVLFPPCTPVRDSLLYTSDDSLFNKKHVASHSSHSSSARRARRFVGIARRGNTSSTLSTPRAVIITALGELVMHMYKGR
jgi:hypothetical protein